MGKFKNRMQANASTGGGSESTGSGVHEPLLDNEVKGASKRGKTLNGSGAADSGGGSSSSEYTRVVRTIHRDLGQFKNVIQHLRKSNKSVGSDSSSASQNKEINRINTSLDSGEQLVHRISDELKGDLAPLTHASDKETQRKRHEELTDLANNFEDLTREYQKIREEIVTQLKSLSASQPGSSNHGRSESGQEQMMGQMQELGEGELELHDAIVEERNRAIEQIEQTATSINQAFKDINTLIHRQGEDLDIADNNVEVAHTQGEKGVEHLESADKYQKSYSKKLICLVAVVLAICIAVAIVLYVKLK
eukprot:gb/GECG01004150.1/.p1 GENE.gb/GECG01004150.1/~~gb/GECG01004150.1/.p1  ORF type:complete len:307 (+),score=36.61 gb/GECG01004150.1/:1-921(+)